jgi:predicted DNA-binding protein with PD1-like motif
MSADVFMQPGRLGRMAVIRLKPGEDLVGGVERAAAEAAFTFAMVRVAVGDLADAALGFGAGETAAVSTIEGPGVEILSLAGEVQPDEDGAPRAFLQGTVADSDAKVFGGAFLPGGNSVCTTAEIVLQEWLPEDL